jgi:hypothetical protein
VKNECRLRLSETDNDDWLKTCINDASRMMETFARRGFWNYEYLLADPYVVPESDLLESKVFLPWPVITLSGVYLDGELLVLGDDYTFENTREGGYGAVISFVSSDTKAWFDSDDDSEGDVELVGVFGYTLATVEGEDDPTAPPVDLPSDIQRACTLIAAAISGLNQRETLNYSGDRVSLTDSRIPKDAMELLKGAKRPVL